MSQPPQQQHPAVVGLQQVPKELAAAPPPPTPTADPPAYSPRVIHPLYTSLYSLGRAPAHMSLHYPGQAGAAAAAAPQVQMVDAEAEDGYDDEDCERLSPIHIRVNAAVRISTNDNLVVLAATPEQSVGTITAAVLSAIKQGSSMNCGIPMIDEWGRPRPVRVEVDAGMDISGSGNVVGSEAVVLDAIRRRHQLRKRNRGESQVEVEDENDDSPSRRNEERQQARVTLGVKRPRSA